MSHAIAISGSTGLIGSALAEHFKSKGCVVSRIVRKQSPYKGSDPCILMDVSAGTIETDKLENLHAVIHLAGTNIAQKWTSENKREITSSRVDSTKLIASALAGLKQKPKVFLCASAIGYYGNHAPQDKVDERTPLGNDHLAQVCQHWEAATADAKNAGIRVMMMRTGIVLSRQGGALAKMLPAFKLGLGGKLGSGKQIMSWIALKEIPLIIDHMLSHEMLEGPVNLVAPQPVTNEGFTRALGRVLKRPVVFPVPAAVIKAIFGEMGEALLLNGACVLPKRLLDSGYQFKYPDIDSALKASLGA